MENCKLEIISVSLELLPMKYSVSIVVIVFKWLKTQLNFYKVIINKNIFLWTGNWKPSEIYISKEIFWSVKIVEAI